MPHKHAHRSTRKHKKQHRKSHAQEDHKHSDHHQHHKHHKHHECHQHHGHIVDRTRAPGVQFIASAPSDPSQSQTQVPYVLTRMLTPTPNPNQINGDVAVMGIQGTFAIVHQDTADVLTLPPGSKCKDFVVLPTTRFADLHTTPSECTINLAQALPSCRFRVRMYRLQSTAIDGTRTYAEFPLATTPALITPADLSPTETELFHPVLRQNIPLLAPGEHILVAASLEQGPVAPTDPSMMAVPVDNVTTAMPLRRA